MNDDERPRWAESIDRVAAILGKSRRTVMNWKNEGCPLVKDPKHGTYDVDAIEAWAEKNKPEKKPKSESKEGLEIRKLEAEVRKLEAEASLKEHDKLKKTEDVVHVEDVQLWLVQLFTEGRRKLMKMSEVVPMGFAPEIRPQIAEEIDKQVEVWLKWMHLKIESTSEIREL